MPDYTGLVSEWQEMLARRPAMGDALSLWTPVLEDWASPHLDCYAARAGYRRVTPSLVHLLPFGHAESAP